jgi:hypothetical protein
VGALHAVAVGMQIEGPSRPDWAATGDETCFGPQERFLDMKRVGGGGLVARDWQDQDVLPGLRIHLCHRQKLAARVPSSRLDRGLEDRPW